MAANHRASQVKVVKRIHGFTLEDSFDILGVDSEDDRLELKSELVAKPLTREYLYEIADHLPNDWDDVVSIMNHLEPGPLTLEDITRAQGYTLSNSGRSLLLLEMWLDRNSQYDNSARTSTSSVTYATLATIFARAGQIDLVEKMIAPFRNIMRMRRRVYEDDGYMNQDMMDAEILMDFNQFAGSSTSVTVMEVAEFKVQSTVKQWLYPNMTRKEAEDYLKPLAPGSFIVRDSKSIVGAYALSVRVSEYSPGPMFNRSSYVMNFVINRSASGKFELFKSSFDNLTKLISRLCFDKFSLPCVLILPPLTSVPDYESADSVQLTTTKEENNSKELLDEAMKFGYVVCHTIILLFIGVAGAGKSSFARFVLNLPPLKLRESTPLAECAVRAVSVSRAKVDQGGMTWNAVSPEAFLSLLADGIKGGLTMFLTNVRLPVTPPNPITTHHNHSGTTPICNTVNTPAKPITLPSKSQISASSTSSPQLPLKPISKATSSSTKNYGRHYIFDSELIRELLKQIEKSDGSKMLHEDDWVYLVDSGGQPQFHELLPTFVHHASGAVFFVKLNEELNSRPTIEYYSKGGELSGEPYPSSLTHLQILQNCLQTMQSRNSVSGKVECPELYFVGTHRDLEAACKESAEEKNQCLHEMLLQHEGLKRHLSYYRLSKPEVLMYPVNSVAPQDCDREVVSDFRHAVINGCKKKPVKIPVIWFLLEQFLQKLSHDKQSCVLSFKECLDVANSLGMDDARLKAALEFLVRLNIFKYFPQHLPSVVFTTAQVLLDKVSELVEYSHLLRCKPKVKSKTRQIGCDSESQRFRDHGTVCAEFLKRFPKHFVDNLFVADDLLQLLVHLLVVAKISDDHYFMPCVLPELSDEELSAYRLNPSKASLVPLLIHFPGEWFPSGIFTSLVSFLENKSNWKVILKHGTPSCLYKNCVKFRLQTSPVTIVLMYSLKYIELHIRVPDDTLLDEVCLGIRSVVLDGLENASEVQNYDHLRPQLAFFCSSSHDDDSECTTDSEYMLPHLASVSGDQKWLLCSLDEEYCAKVTEKHQLWLKDSDYMDDAIFEQPEVTSAAAKSHGTTSLSLLNVTTSLKKLVDWHTLGVKLGIESSTLDCIRIDFAQYGTSRQRDELIKTWLRSDTQASWIKLCSALEVMDERKLADQIAKQYRVKS